MQTSLLPESIPVIYPASASTTLLLCIQSSSHSCTCIIFPGCRAVSVCVFEMFPHHLDNNTSHHYCERHKPVLFCSCEKVFLISSYIRLLSLLSLAQHSAASICLMICTIFALVVQVELLIPLKARWPVCFNIDCHGCCCLASLITRVRSVGWRQVEAPSPWHLE